MMHEESSQNTLLASSRGIILYTLVYFIARIVAGHESGPPSESCMPERCTESVGPRRSTCASDNSARPRGVGMHRLPPTEARSPWPKADAVWASEPSGPARWASACLLLRKSGAVRGR